MNPTSRTRLRALRVAAPPLALALALTACTSSSHDGDATKKTAPPEGVVSYQPQAWSPADSTTALGSKDETIPSVIPEKLHVGAITPITKNDLVTLPGGFGSLEDGLQVLDPTTGATHSRIVVGPGIWEPVVHAFIGAKPSDPAVLAGEVWRPRGSRGKADFTVSTYAGDLLKPDEIKLPDYARLHSRTGSHAVTSDGRYFVSWDDGLYGLRVIDLKEHKESGALALRGCGPFTWTVGHDVYSVCQDTRELVRISIDAQGRPKVAGRAKVLPADFTGARTVGWAADAKQGLLIDAGGDVYLPDFSHGLPSAPLKPVGNAGRAEGRFADSVINSTAGSVAVAYTDSAANPDSAQAGDKSEVVLYAAAAFRSIAVLPLKKLGVTGIAAIAYGYDGKTLYVVGAGAEKEGRPTQKVVGVDAATGRVVSSKTIQGALGDIGGLITPEAIG
nr:hypothetical protein OH826_18700 [Streptomyces sp. NBC_00899]